MDVSARKWNAIIFSNRAAAHMSLGETMLDFYFIIFISVFCYVRLCCEEWWTHHMFTVT